MDKSIFTRIIDGELPCYKVHEDRHTFAFLDIHPVQPGQVLVVSKRQVADIWQLPEEEYIALMRTVREVGMRLRRHFATQERVGLQVEGLEVPHVHVKVFPFSTGEEFRSTPDQRSHPTEAELARIAKALAF